MRPSLKTEATSLTARSSCSLICSLTQCRRTSLSTISKDAMAFQRSVRVTVYCSALLEIVVIRVAIVNIGCK